jgi:hypothetical protein
VPGRIKSMKNPKERIGNRNHDIPACSAVPQRAALSRPSPLTARFLYTNKILTVFAVDRELDVSGAFV